MIRTIRVVTFFVIWSSFGATAAGEVMHLDGLILGASLPWSDRLFDERDGSLLAFPVHLVPLPYTGILTIDAQSSLASFQVSVDSCIAGAEYCLTAVDPETGNIEKVSAPTTYRLAANVFAGVVRNDVAALMIDYTSPVRPDEGVTSFAFALDKTTGEGEWHWTRRSAEICIGNVCAPSLPGEEARGTITGFRVVPEPESLALGLLGGMAVIVAQAVSRQR